MMEPLVENQWRWPVLPVEITWELIGPHHKAPSHPCRLLADGRLANTRVEPTANPSGLHCTIATANHWTPHFA